MFSISNKIAYGGLMILDLPGRTESNLPPSAWIHVPPGPQLNGHWYKDEQEMVIHLLKLLREKGVNLGQVFMVSPFRHCAYGLQEVGRHFRMNDKFIGTIHTSQGKEADVVILVLGGATPGSRDWASSSPNLLNVAVSRAKQRLYVIGNRRNWSKGSYFEVLNSMLPVADDAWFDGFDTHT